MLVDRRILAGGAAMLIVGISLSLYISSQAPVGTSEMSADEAMDLILKQREGQDMNTLAGILVGVGFLLVLISFGARRKRRGGAKRVEKKPDIGM